MKEIEKENLHHIDGGTGISGTLINAFSTGIKTILEVGRSFGTSLRRVFSNNMCSL